MGFLEDMQKSFFFANTGGAGQSASAQDMRRKIALAMLMKKNAPPKTFGEGLAAIGDAWGDRSLAARVEAEAEAQSAKTDAAIGSQIPPLSPTTTGPRAEAGDPPLAVVASAVDTPLDGNAPPATAPPAAAPVATSAATPPPGGIHPNVANWHGFATRPADQGGLGVNPAQAAGIVGNLQAESGPTIKPWGVVGDKGTAFGAAQWRNDRFANLQNFAKSNGMDPRTTEAQQAFMRHELMGQGAHGGGSEARAFQALRAAQDPSSAAAAFDQNYERSSGEHRARRQAAAVNLARVMNDPNATPRDRVAAVEAARTADTPPTQGDMAQEARISDVMGMTRAPPSYGATASLGGRTGDVQSDAPPVTGALQGPLGQAVGDTVQARQDTMTPPPQVPPVEPAPPPQQVAQASPFPNPVVAADGRVAPVIPGGGLPPPIAPQVSSAPPDPRSAIRTVPQVEPYKPGSDAQPEPPVAPGAGPIEAQLTRDILNKDVDPRLKAAAAARIEAERAQRAIPYNNAMKKYDAEIADWKMRRQQDRSYLQTQEATVLANEKARRELEGEGAVPLTPEQRKQFAIPDTQSAYITRRGEIKFGPVGTHVNVNTGDKAQGKGDERLQEKLSEHFIKTFEEGNTAGDEIKQLAEMRALAARVGTGAGAVIKQALGNWGIKTEGLSEIQALQAGISRLIPQQRVPGSGTSSDFDGENFKQSVVGLSKTPEGNNLIFDTMDGLAQNKLARAEVAGRVVSGELTRQEGVKEMLALQRQAKDLSDKVKEHLKATGQDKSVKPAVPAEVTESAAEKWANDPANASNPKARIIREDLERRRRGGQ
jgi:hypothetical protein